jgi:hypothetical protein
MSQEADNKSVMRRYVDALQAADTAAVRVCNRWFLAPPLRRLADPGRPLATATSGRRAGVIGGGQ